MQLKQRKEEAYKENARNKVLTDNMNDLIAVEHSQTKQICELELDLDAVKTKVTDFELEMEQQ
jgi:hypothetical protein